MLTVLGFFGKGMKVLTSFLGVDKTIAQTQIVSEGFTLGTVTEINSTNPSDELDHNKVILQSPISGSLVDYESPISINWRSFTFTPAPYSFTPYSFTPGPYSFTPFAFTPYSFTPYSFTPYSFTPPPVEKYFSYAYCQNNSLNGYSGMAISIGGWSTVAEACAATAAALAPYGISQFTCVEGTASSPLYTNMGVVCSAPSTKNYYEFTYYDGKCNYAVYDYLDNYIGSYSTNLCTNSGTDASGATLPSCSNAGCSDGTPYSFTPYSFTPYSFTPYAFTPSPSGVWYTYCGYVGAGYDPGTVVGPIFSSSQTCSQALAQLTSFGEIGSGWNCLPGTSGSPSISAASCGTPYSFTPYSFTPYSFVPGVYSFTPYSFTPYSFTPYAFTPYAFTPYSFTPESTGCRQAKPYPYCFCEDSAWLC